MSIIANKRFFQKYIMVCRHYTYNLTYNGFRRYRKYYKKKLKTTQKTRN